MDDACEHCGHTGMVDPVELRNVHEPHDPVLFCTTKCLENYLKPVRGSEPEVIFFHE